MHVVLQKEEQQGKTVVLVEEELLVKLEVEVGVAIVAEAVGQEEVEEAAS